MRSQTDTYLIITSFLLATVAYITGMFRVGIMDIDASLYAEMSREMLKSGSFLEFRNRVIEHYLDKPPLIFWSSAVSYALFGVNEFAYRLPTFLSTLLGTWSVYRFSKLFYNTNASIFAALMLYTCQAWFLVNHDVRTDTMLANFTMFATWQLAAYLQSRKALNFILGFAGIGMAMLAKGPIGLVVPAIGLGAHLIYKREWKNIFRLEWLFGILITGLVLSPMIISLYRQFGTYGLEFYFWTQSFGRITGENYWQDQSGPFFFVHTFLWSFLPWSVFGIAAIIFSVWKIIKSKLGRNGLPEVITTGAFLIVFIILSRSSYKLPHYIYVVFPFVAVFTGDFADRYQEHLQNKAIRKTLTGFQYFVAIALPLAAIAIVLIGFPFENSFLYLFPAAGLLIPLALLFRLHFKNPFWFYLCLLSIIFTNILLNNHIYPKILDYQADKRITGYLSENDIDAEKIYQLEYHSSAFDFQSKSTSPHVNTRKLERLAGRSELWVLTSEDGLEMLQESQLSYSIEKSFDYYPVQIITWKFIQKETREETLRKVHLVRVMMKNG